MEATTLRSAGYDVAIICPIGKGAEATREVIDGIHIYRHPLPPDISSVKGYLAEYWNALRHEWRLMRVVQRIGGIDIIHICNPPDVLFLVALWPKLCGARVIYDQHDLNPELYEAKYRRRGPLYLALRIAEWLTYKVANLVIATNESHRAMAVARGGKRPEDVFIVRSGPDLNRFRAVPANTEFRRGRTHLVGYVGVMGEQEGIDLLLRAIRHIAVVLHRSDIHFVLIGSGPSLLELQALAEQLEIQALVEFTGRIPDDEMIERLSTTDLCVAPDLKNPFNDCCTMNKVLEYMALGKPLVQFDVVEGRRSAADAALYATDNSPVDFANKILELIDDPRLCAEMGQRGRERMRDELEWKHQVPRLLSAYRRAGA
ncbi:MAG TPA: glycosyltransferase family 4 protein [Gemmatimonadaceae bacterium]|jgi:glycosyltransferase involved in cell wall biosynthesis